MKKLYAPCPYRAKTVDVTNLFTKASPLVTVTYGIEKYTMFGRITLRVTMLALPKNWRNEIILREWLKKNIAFILGLDMPCASEYIEKLVTALYSSHAVKIVPCDDDRYSVAVITFLDTTDAALRLEFAQNVHY